MYELITELAEKDQHVLVTAKLLYILHNYVYNECQPNISKN